MRSFDRIIRKSAMSSGAPEDENRIMQTVEVSVNAFAEHEYENTTGYAEFLLQQAVYIRKRWWVLQGLILIVLWLAISLLDSSVYTMKMLGVTAPLFGLMIIPEMSRNRSSGSMEIELTAYHSLRAVYSARILTFALTDLMILSLFYACSFAASGLDILSFLTGFMLPLSVTCCICFRSMCCRYAVSDFFSMLLCMIWDGAWTLIVMDARLYSAVSVPVWIMLLILSVIYLLYCIRKLLRLRIVVPAS